MTQRPRIELGVPLKSRWQGDAACRDSNANVFPYDNEPIAGAVARLRPFALQHCAVCPVREVCYAQPDRFGLWGGELRTEHHTIPLTVTAAHPACDA